MNNTANATAIIALIVSVIALVLGWVAFNRSGADIEEIVQREVEEATVEFNANLEDLEASFRQNTADELQEAADDVEEDQAPNDAGE